MAYPSTEANRFRDKVTAFVENMREIDAILAVVEDQGVDDPARQAFFAIVFDGSYDVTWATFAAGVVALRAMRTARDTNKLAIAKLLK